jgi:hypothetical protein
MFPSTLVGVLPPSVPVRPSNSNGLVLLALVLGLVLGATAVGMIWFVSGRSASAAELPPADAVSDATAACATLASVPALSSPAFSDPTPQGVPAGSYQLAGAASLASAAKSEDSRYAALSDALNNASMIIGRQFDHQAVIALADARAACADW